MCHVTRIQVLTYHCMTAPPIVYSSITRTLIGNHVFPSFPYLSSSTYLPSSNSYTPPPHISHPHQLPHHPSRPPQHTHIPTTTRTYATAVECSLPFMLDLLLQLSNFHFQISLSLRSGTCWEDGVHQMVSAATAMYKQILVKYTVVDWPFTVCLHSNHPTSATWVALIFRRFV